MVGCSSPPSPPPAPPPASSPRPAPAPITKCAPNLDAAEVLARHAKSYGAPDAITKGLPWTLHGEIELQGKKGATDVVLGERSVRATSLVSGLFFGTGLDGEGAWVLSAGAGVVERLGAPDEDIDAHYDAWLLRKGWVKAKPDAVKCIDDPAGARADVSFSVFGDLSFDLASGALLSASRRLVDGRTERITFESWHPPDDSGIRWPKQTTSHPSSGNVAVTTFEKPKHGLECTRRGPGGTAMPERGEACTHAPEGTFAIKWPASGRAKIPLTYVRRSLLVRVNAGGRDVPAFLDSGASVTVVDAATPAGQAFVPAFDVEGAGATQKIKVGFGALPSITIGELSASNVPCASVPIPALEAMGKSRPEVILGYSFFAASVVRVDYKRNEIVFAKPGTSLAAADARSMPLRVASGKLLAKANLEGNDAWFEVDTGNTGGLDPYRAWENAHGLPGDRPVTTAMGRFGAGTQETPARFYRLKKASLGPVVFDGGLVHDGDPPDVGDIAGLVGNSVFAKCDAIVIDHHARKLFFDGRAGHDDVVLEVGGKPMSEDPAVLEAIETQPEGTNVPVVVMRDGKKERFVVELKKLLP